MIAENTTATADPWARGSGNSSVTRASADGMSVAPAIPSAARAAMSSSGVGANAAASDATPNAAAPTSRSRRRPMRSPSVPMVTRKPATRNP